MLRSKSAELIAAGSVALCALFVFSASGVAGEIKQVGVSRAAGQASTSDPLNQLRERSPGGRWSELRKMWGGVDRDGQPSTISVPQQQIPQNSNGGPSMLEQGSSSAPTLQLETPTQVPGINAQFTAQQQQVPAVDQPGTEESITLYAEPLTNPNQLKRVTDIQPYFDYEPDATIRAQDPCTFLCPRPDGAPCTPLDPDDKSRECPEEIRLSDSIYEGRTMPETIFAWQASNVYHNPLYFEDPALERYGHSHGTLLQPFASVGRFSAQLLGLPYQMTIDPVCDKEYPLGWYRPGECAPKLCYQVPLNLHAAAVTAGVYTGLIYAIP